MAGRISPELFKEAIDNARSGCVKVGEIQVRPHYTVRLQDLQAQVRMQMMQRQKEFERQT